MGYGISKSYGILLVTELVDTQIHGLLQVMGYHKYGLWQSWLYRSSAYLPATSPFPNILILSKRFIVSGALLSATITSSAYFYDCNFHTSDIGSSHKWHRLYTDIWRLQPSLLHPWSYLFLNSLGYWLRTPSVPGSSHSRTRSIGILDLQILAVYPAYKAVLAIFQ